MSDTADPIDWQEVRAVFPPEPAQAVDAGPEVRGVMEEARRRMAFDPAFHARVTQATRIALANARPRDPDTARRWIELGAALAVVLDLREPITYERDPRRPIL